VKLLSYNLNVCDHNPPSLQTDGRTDGQTIAIAYVRASLGKML